MTGGRKNKEPTTAALEYHRRQRAVREVQEGTRPVSLRVPNELLNVLEDVIKKEADRSGGKGPTLSELILDLVRFGLGLGLDGGNNE